MNSFSSPEEQIQYQAKNIEFLQEQNYDLQNQISVYSELQKKGVTLQNYELMQNTIKDLQNKIKTLNINNANLQKQLDSNQVKFYDKTLQQLQTDNAKLKSEIKQIKQQKSIPVQPKKYPQQQQLAPSLILSQSQDLSKQTNFVLHLLTPPNFKSPYLEIIKNKYENVKFIKKLKNGFEKSYFDLHHFDQIAHEISQQLQYIDRINQPSQSRGMLLSNQLILIYGQSKTQKKHFIIQYLDTLLFQIHQQYQVLLSNEEYQHIQIQITFSDQNKISHLIYITQDNNIELNQQILKEAEMQIQKIKLNILNKIKKHKTKIQSKVRFLEILVERKYSSETIQTSVKLYTSNISLSKNYKFFEQGLTEILQLQDNGKEIMELMKLPQISIQLVLCVHPTIPDYDQTSIAFQLYQLFKNVKFNVEVAQNSDKYSAILENQINALEIKLLTTKQKQKQAQWEAYRAKQQQQILMQQNDDAVQKNTKLKEAYNVLLQQIQQLQTTLSQQISAKKIQTNSIQPQQQLKSLEKTQKSLSNLLFKNSILDLSISPSKIQRTLENIRPTSSGESEDQFDIMDADEPSEEESTPPRKESSISMI